MKGILFTSLLVFFSNRIFAATCGYTFTVPAINYTVSTTNASTLNNLTLSRGNTGSANCNTFLIGFSKGGANSYTRIATNASTGATINYNVYLANNSTASLKLIADATSTSEVVTGSVAKNGTTTLDYYFLLGTLSSTTLTRGGTYKDSLTLTVDAGTLTRDRGQEATQPLAVNIIVPKIASLSLVNTGASYDSLSTNKTLDFGELTAGQEMSFDVIVLSNAGYNLSVSSSNNEVLQLSGATPAANTKIDYDFYSGGIQRVLTTSSSAPVSISSGAGVTPMAGSRIPIKVVIQSVTDKVAGTYQDYVTFTIATTE